MQKFRYVYFSAHGDDAGCSFCADGSCHDKREVLQQICPSLDDDAVVFAACCSCGGTPAAREVACGCARVSEVVGPAGKLSFGELCEAASSFFAAISHKGVSPNEAAAQASTSKSALVHTYVSDLDLRECEP